LFFDLCDSFAVRSEFAKNHKLWLMDPFLQKLQIIIFKYMSHLLIVLLDSVLQGALFLVDFANFFVEERFEQQRLLTDTYNFGVVFDHFDSTLMTVQHISVLFLLKSCIFEMMIHTYSLMNTLFCQIFFYHLLRKYNKLFFTAFPLSLLSLKVLFVSTEG